MKEEGTNKMQEKTKLERCIIVPNEIFCLGLTGYEIGLYTYLLYCEDRKTYICCPGLKRIAERLCSSKETVRKHLRELEYKNLIEIKNTRSSLTRLNWKLEIRILPIKQAYDSYIHSMSQKFRK